MAAAAASPGADKRAALDAWAARVFPIADGRQLTGNVVRWDGQAGAPPPTEFTVQLAEKRRKD